MTEEQANGNDEVETNECDESTIKKHRSPNYPNIGLEAAIERASELQKIAGVHPVRVTTAWETWGYKRGSGNQIVAALDAYGLISIESGISDNRQIKLTMEARKILDNTSERSELLKTAALAPLLHKEIWDNFNGDLPPNDKVISEYLKYQRNFNPAYVDKFIEQFRATLAFANVTKSDKINSVSNIETNNERTQENLGNDSKGGNEMDSGEKIRQAMTLPQGVIFRASIEVFANGALDVVFAGSMNAQTVTLLKEIYDIKEKNEAKMLQSNTAENAPVRDIQLLESGERKATENE